MTNAMVSIFKPSPLVLASRKSALAMVQTRAVQSLLAPCNTEILGLSTKGDEVLDRPLVDVGGKGVFVKTLEAALLSGKADAAVHSMKDMETHIADGTAIAAVLPREDRRDALVGPFADLDELPQGAVVRTSSLRRQCQVRALRPDLDIRDLRGNVNTRLAKLDNGDYDAIILAAAGLLRLEMPERIADFIEPETSLPANGQGAVGIECRSDDERVKALLAPLEHTETRIRVLAERAMNRRLEGGCQVPIGAYALVNGEQVHIRGLVGAVDGSEILRDEVSGSVENAEQLGVQLAEQLLAQGADKILAEVYRDA